MGVLSHSYVGNTSVLPDIYRVVLGTGRSITRAIGQFFLLDEVWEVELRKSSEKKKEKNIVEIRTHAHSFDGPVQLPLAHRDTAVEFRLIYS